MSIAKTEAMTKEEVIEKIFADPEKGKVVYEDFIPPLKDDGTFEQLTPYERSLLYTPKDHPREFI